ncbi:serine hydrolase domain-containing protein [Candidatus Harpocratesius sp.]
MNNISHNLQDLDKYIRKYMRSGKIPGLAISIIHKGQLVYSKGFGARDLEKGLPMTPQTLIGIGSVTKSFTAIAIMKLVESGMLSLDDSVSKYLPYPPFSNHRNVQIRHLLSHSSGIPACDASLFEMFYLFGDFSRICPVQSRDQFLAHISDAEKYFYFSPGEHFFYNNDMYVCLGFIIENLTGRSYAEFVKSEILDPLQMTNVAFTLDQFNNHPENNRMAGYLPKLKDKKTVLTKAPVPVFNDLQAPGGLYVSMEDMMHYAECLLNKGRYNNIQLIQPNSVEELWNPVIPTPYGYGPQPKYCLGWVIDEGINGIPYTLIHHGGGLGTSCSFFAIIPELKIGISVAQNTCIDSVEKVGRAAIAYLLGQKPEIIFEDFRRIALLNEICGEYIAPYGMYSMKISEKKGIINAQLEIDDGALEFPLYLENFEKLQFVVCRSISPKPFYVQFYRDSKNNHIKFATFDRYIYMKQI